MMGNYSQSDIHLIKAHCCSVDEVSALACGLTNASVPADDRRRRVALLGDALEDLIRLERVVERIHSNVRGEA